MLDNRKALEVIKAAVDAGKEVWEGIYHIIKDDAGQYLVVCHWNGHTVGLHGLPGTKYEFEPNVWLDSVTIDGKFLEDFL